MRASEALTHWYRRDGSPCYTVIGKNGKERDTTLRDARLLGLVPSVTGIIKQAAAPNLVHYMQEQVLMSALTLPRNAHENEDAWLRRVWQDSREHARKAAEKGTAIHAAIEQHYQDTLPAEEYWPHVKGVADLLADRFPGASFITEESFCNPLGYGGKTDLHSRAGQGLVLDIKSKELSHEKAARAETYDEQHMQLASYREGLGLPNALCGIVYVSTSVPGLAVLVMVDEDKLQRAWMMFKSLLNYWVVKNKFVWYPTLEEK